MRIPYDIVVDLSHKEKLEEFPEFALGEDDFEINYIDKKTFSAIVFWIK